MRLDLRVSVSPTEDRSKVLIAATNILGECGYAVEERDDFIFIRSSDFGCLRKIRDQLRDRHVRDAARRLLVKNREGSRVSLMFNRQAAFAGVIAVVSSGEESPLGPVTLQIECGRMDELIDWLSVPRPEGPPGQVHRAQQSSA